MRTWPTSARRLATIPSQVPTPMINTARIVTSKAMPRRIHLSSASIIAESNQATMSVANAQPMVRRAATNTLPATIAVPMAAMTSNVEPSVGLTRNAPTGAGSAGSSPDTGLQ